MARQGRGTEVFLGLGSNLGDRRANLREAVRRLREQVQVTDVSSVYETAPAGYAEQPDFLNAVCRGRTELDPPTLLGFIKGVETAMGRRPTFPNGPRLIDIDILLYGDAVVESPEVTVPHPRMAGRAFVLVPLAEIAPEARHPVLGRTAAELAAAMGSEGVRRVAGPGAIGWRRRRTADKSSWLEMAVAVPPELVEPVTELFAKRGKAAVAIEEAPGGEAWEPSAPSTAPVTVRAYLPGGSAGHRRRARIEAGLALLGMIMPMPQPQSREVQAEEWESVLRGHFTPIRVGKRLVVVPEWQEHAAGAGDMVIKLDPGAAFGTGHHPTTRLCLELLEEHVPPGADVLDVGTGSGILAIAAGLLGARRVLGVDTDPVAVRMARRNVRSNRLQRRVTIVRGSLPLAAPERFGLVVANITAGVLGAIMPHLQEAMAPQGTLLLSGVLQEQLPGLEERARACGLTMTEKREDGDWTATIWFVG